MISVQVKLFATLRRHFPELEIGEAMAVRVPDGATVAELLDTLNLRQDEVKLVFVNGVSAKTEQPLSGGDEVGIFPPVGGG